MMNNSNFKRYAWTTAYVILGIVIGILLVYFFCYSEGINAFSPLLWSSAYLVIGALLGFVFSVPKIISDNPPTPSNNSSTLDNGQRKRIEENTNLTQISDWLTKILIGAGLVQLKDTPKFVLDVAKVMGQGIRKTPQETINVIDAATIICAAIILYFLTWGFISGYLVMKLVLTEQFANLTQTEDQEQK